jgi:hypothetical protein
VVKEAAERLGTGGPPLRRIGAGPQWAECSIGGTSRRERFKGIGQHVGCTPWGADQMGITP